MKVLGIETSCDETAAAIVTCDKYGTGKILSNVVWSQIKEHQVFGGVVPEIAARAHTAKLDTIIKQTLIESNSTFEELQAIAVTAGPGLIGGLMIGLITAKSLCLALNKPLLAINHLEAHALTARLTNKVTYPYLLLLISGGHSQILIIEDFQKYKRLGSTIDDALGETFDKVAKLLNIGYPGGVQIEQLALKGDCTKYKFPQPLKGKNTFNFSFSGLKTAVRNCIAKEESYDNLTLQTKADICASFQYAICEILKDRMNRAMDLFSSSFPNDTAYMVIAGGVAANKVIFNNLNELSKNKQFICIVPPINLCTDNAAMVAWAGCEYLNANLISDLNVAARARWPLDNNTLPLVGFGKKGAKV